MKINLVMIVKDEERCLGKCLAAARPLVDEMIVVDTGSVDHTRRIASEAGARIYDFAWTRDFSAARNYGLGRSEADWNLVLDADEYLRPMDRARLEEEIRRADKYYGHGRWMGAILEYHSYRDFGEDGAVSVSTALHPRLLPRWVRYCGMVHEQPDTDIPCFLLPLEADHDGYLMQGKGERNLGYLAEAVQKEPANPYYWYQMAVTLRSLGRLGESLEWFRKLWEAGVQGGSYWVDGILRYLYTLMDLGTAPSLEEAKAVIDGIGPEMRRRADFFFVRGLFYMKLVLSDVSQYINYLPEIEKSYLECLQIGEHPEMEVVSGTGSFKAAYNLGLWYEVSGQTEKAREYYQMSAGAGYAPAAERLALLLHG